MIKLMSGLLVQLLATNYCYCFDEVKTPYATYRSFSMAASRIGSGVSSFFKTWCMWWIAIQLSHTIARCLFAAENILVCVSVPPLLVSLHIHAVRPRLFGSHPPRRPPAPLKEHDPSMQARRVSVYGRNEIGKFSIKIFQLKHRQNYLASMFHLLCLECSCSLSLSET